MISLGSYSENSPQANCMVVYLPHMDIYFSYETPVAYTFKGETVVRENDWSNTTGKHLNWIDGGAKKERISGELFERRLGYLLEDA